MGPVISTPVTDSENVTVKLTLDRLVGLGLTRTLERMVGAVPSVIMPVPFKGTEVGEVGALLGMEIEPAFTPTEAGEKVMLKLQVSDGTMVALLQVLLLSEYSPVTDKVPITRLAVPVLVTVKDFAELAVPTF